MVRNLLQEPLETKKQRIILGGNRNPFLLSFKHGPLLPKMGTAHQGS